MLGAGGPPQLAVHARLLALYCERHNVVSIEGVGDSSAKSIRSPAFTAYVPLLVQLLWLEVVLQAGTATPLSRSSKKPVPFTPAKLERLNRFTVRLPAVQAMGMGITAKPSPAPWSELPQHAHGGIKIGMEYP